MAVLAHENEVPVNGDGDHDNNIRNIIYIKRRDLRAIRQCAVIGVKIDPAVLTIVLDPLQIHGLIDITFSS